VAAKCRDQVNGSKAGVGNDNQAAVRQPTLGLQDDLTRPIDHGLVPAIVLVAPALGGGENRQERQCPAPVGPRDGHHDHERQPAQAARPDEMAARGAHRVAVDATRLDLGAPAPLNRVVDADHHFARRQESIEHLSQKRAPHGASVPARPPQHVVVATEARPFRQAHDPQRLAHRALARRQHRSSNQHQDASPDRRREAVAKGGQPSGKYGRRQA